VSFAAIFVPNCDYPAGLLFFAMGPVMGALYMAAVGLLLAVMLPRKWATLCVILWLLSTAAWNLWLFYATPQVFAYNPVLGFYSGTIYDEVIELTPTYLAYRVNTLIQIALFMLIGALAGVLQERGCCHRLLLFCLALKWSDTASFPGLWVLK
jgi:ABC-type enterochelin transport system permease subunit